MDYFAVSLMPQPIHIIIPCYNPHDGWELELAAHVKDFTAYLQRDIRLVLVNDASQKNVTETAIQFLTDKIPGFTYISYPENKGKGYALREGSRAIGEGIVLYTDIDFPYTFESMRAVVAALDNGTDVAVGTRDEVYYENTPKRRTIISKILRNMFRVLFHLPVTDTQCGLKGFNLRGKEVFMQTRINRFLFDMEFIALAAKRKDIRLDAVPVTLRNNIHFSRMNAKIIVTELYNFVRIFFLTNFR